MKEKNKKAVLSQRRPCDAPYIRAIPPWFCWRLRPPLCTYFDSEQR